MDMKFKNWPFDKNEDVYLHWLRSPYHAGQHKQWQMQAVFRRESGTLHDLAMPWGGTTVLSSRLCLPGWQTDRGEPFGHSDADPVLLLAEGEYLRCDIGAKAV